MFKMNGYSDLKPNASPLQMTSSEVPFERKVDTSITPVQQMISSCTGALATSIFGIQLLSDSFLI